MSPGGSESPSAGATREDLPRSPSDRAPRPPFVLGEAHAPAPGSVVLVGPSGSGKTSLLTALGRAFAIARPPEWLRFVPGRELADLMSRVPRPNGTPRPVTSSLEVAPTYTFQLGLQGEVSPAHETEEMEVTVLDTPGAFYDILTTGSTNLDDADRTRLTNLVRATRHARCLVLCTDLLSDRTIELTSFVSRLMTIGPRRLRRMDAKPWPARESPWERAPRLELPFERVLVLLTGIAALCEDLAKTLLRAEAAWLSASPTEIKSLAPLRPMSAWEVAELLDTRALADDRIADLSLLASSLKSGAQFGLCAVSSDPIACRTDESLLAADGLQGPRAGLNFQPEEPIALREPAPFGIWASLLFMTTGQTVPPLITIELDPVSSSSASWSCLRKPTLEER